MKLLKTLGIVSLGVIGYAHGYAVELKNNTDKYDVKMTVDTATAGSQYPSGKIGPNSQNSVTTGGDCPTYVKLEFYKDGKKVSGGSIVDKLSGPYYFDEGDIWYNLGGTWGSFSCRNLYLELQTLSHGDMQLSVE